MRLKAFRIFSYKKRPKVKYLNKRKPLFWSMGGRGRPPGPPIPGSASVSNLSIPKLIKMYWQWCNSLSDVFRRHRDNLRHHVRSSFSNQLSVLTVKSSTYGAHCLSVSGTNVWNNLYLTISESRRSPSTF